LKKSLKWFEKPLHWSNILLIIITLITYIAPLVNPKMSGWFSVLGLMYPILLIFNLIFLAYWLFRKQYTLVIISILTLFLGWNYLTATFGVNYFSSPQPTENQLKVGSYNIRNFRIIGKWKETKAIEKIQTVTKFYKDNPQDILCFQEFRTSGSRKDVLNEVSNSLKGKFIATDKFSLYIASKYPIINSESIKTQENAKHDLSCLFADIQINNNLIIRIYNIHLESNKVTDETENLEINSEKIQHKSTWKTIYNVLRNIKNNQKIRVTQMQTITEHIQGSPYPVIICGDFNDTPLSYTYHLMSKNLNDSFIKKGKGWGTTYNGNIPFLKIDYIFSDYRFNISESKIHHEYKGSDHFPITTILNW
jgi:endonuclease/exonuclease/phosphatase family metal-dependent hydrolase